MKSGRFLVGALLLAACGKRGDPLPPIRVVPQPVTELRLAQRGDKLETAYVAPRVATDSSRLGVIDIEISRADKAGDFAKVAVRTTKRAAPGEALVDREDVPAIGTTVRVVARAISKRRASNPTPLATLTVMAAPLAPTELQGEVGPSGNVLRWSYPGPLPTPVPLPTPTPSPTASPVVSPSAAPVPGEAAPSPAPVTVAPPTVPSPQPSVQITPSPSPSVTSPVSATPSPDPSAPLPAPSAGARPSGPPGAPGAKPTPTPTPKPVGFLVYRRAKDGSFSRALQTDVFSAMSFEDTTVAPGQEWCYVTRFAMSADPIIESESSPEVCLTFKDIAAPAAPVGVSVFLRGSGIEVSWSPSAETDLASYRVYRRAPPSEPPVLVGEVAAPETTLKDPGAKAGIVNVYIVTAVDTAGNEGAASTPVQVRP